MQTYVTFAEKDSQKSLLMITNDKQKVVRDHPYFTSKYRGATHSICNLRFNVSSEIPDFFIVVQTMINILS